ncbi:MurR/RpiR family transcriptional regulator [Muricoccus vinaceus]|uniref:MurR/RpiR family transcriptional regulator n=1 Tax=Muricoccus vinaceus TaxID=424704 RepID=A0ABV6IX36_9PROT
MSQTADITPDPLARLLAGAPDQPPAARRVARWIADHPADALAASAAALAAACRTSDATVIRVVQALGFAGLPDLKRALADHLAGRPGVAGDLRRTLAETGEDPGRAVAAVLDAHREALEALAAPTARAAIAAAVEALHPAARVHVFGIGPSAPLARYAATMLTRGGRATSVLDATGIGLADGLLGLARGDALLMLAYGRPYHEATVALAEADALGMPTVLVTDEPGGPLARRARHVVAARRGRARRVALHGATLVVLEAIVLGLAACAGPAAPAALDRLNDFRAALSGGSRLDVG